MEIGSRAFNSRSKVKKVLLLNADYTVLAPLTSKRAINLCATGKARILKAKGNTKLHPKLNLIGKPIIIQLTSYTRVPRRSVPITRRNILLRDSFVCQYSGEILTERNASIDHIIPKSHIKFPGNSWDNLVACSKKINNLKGNRLPEEVGLKLLNKPSKPNWENLIVKRRPEWVEFMNDLKSGKIY